MSRSLIRLSALLLATILLSSPAAAAPSGRIVPKAEWRIVTLVRQLFGGLVAGAEKAHGTMDPNGTLSPSSSSTGKPGEPMTEGDAHGTMDPDG